MGPASRHSLSSAGIELTDGEAHSPRSLSGAAAGKGAGAAARREAAADGASSRDTSSSTWQESPRSPARSTEDRRGAAPSPRGRRRGGPTAEAGGQAARRERAIRGLFELYDTDGSGAISKAETYRYARRCGYAGSPEEWDMEWVHIHRHCGLSPDGGLTLDDFARWLNDGPEDNYTETQALEALLSRERTNAGRADALSGGTCEQARPSGGRDSAQRASPLELQEQRRPQSPGSAQHEPLLTLQGRQRQLPAPPDAACAEPPRSRTAPRRPSGRTRSPEASSRGQQAASPALHGGQPRPHSPRDAASAQDAVAPGARSTTAGRRHRARLLRAPPSKDDRRPAPTSKLELPQPGTSSRGQRAASPALHDEGQRRPHSPRDAASAQDAVAPGARSTTAGRRHRARLPQAPPSEDDRWPASTSDEEPPQVELHGTPRAGGWRPHAPHLVPDGVVHQPCEASTQLLRASWPGQTRLIVAAQHAFAAGDIVSVTSGEHSEKRTVVGLGPMLLDRPLSHGHPVGAVVSKQGSTRRTCMDRPPPDLPEQPWADAEEEPWADATDWSPSPRTAAGGRAEPTRSGPACPGRARPSSSRHRPPHTPPPEVGRHAQQLYLATAPCAEAAAPAELPEDPEEHARPSPPSGAFPGGAGGPRRRPGAPPSPPSPPWASPVRVAPLDKPCAGAPPVWEPEEEEDDDDEHQRKADLARLRGASWAVRGQWKELRAARTPSPGRSAGTRSRSSASPRLVPWTDPVAEEGPLRLEGRTDALEQQQQQTSGAAGTRHRARHAGPPQQDAPALAWQPLEGSCQGGRPLTPWQRRRLRLPSPPRVSPLAGRPEPPWAGEEQDGALGALSEPEPRPTPEAAPQQRQVRRLEGELPQELEVHGAAHPAVLGAAQGQTPPRGLLPSTPCHWRSPADGPPGSALGSFAAAISISPRRGPVPKLLLEPPRLLQLVSL